MDGSSFYWSIITYNAALMFIFACLYFVERKKHILYWSGYWFCNTLSSIIISFENTSAHFIVWNTLENIIGIFSIWAIAAGSIGFFRGKFIKLLSLVSLIPAIYYIIIGFMGLSLEFYFVPRLVFGGALLIYTGMVSIRVPYVKSKTRYVLGVCFLLWGGSNLFDILGYALGPSIFLTAFTLIGLLSTATTIVIQMLYFQKSRENQASIDEKMRHLIMYDSLTGIYNRGYCEIEMSRLDKEDRLPISVILGDLNGLKLINDTFGHKKGDQVLISAADIMKTAAPGHIVGRWGGDEFIIVMPGTDANRAAEIMKQIKGMCREHKKDNVPMDISLGMSTMERPGQSLDDTVEAADNILYKNKFAESRFIRNSITDYLKNMLLEKNIETEEHVLRMKEMAYLVAQQMGLSQKEREDLAMVAFMHDIGKISIPDNILKKPGKLTGDEWEIMKKHSAIGYRITMSSDEFAHISQSVLSHHERWDGKGYPQGLKGSEIPLLARVISIIDAYDAMTHARVYKEATSVEDALAEIERCSGKQFDPGITGVFINIIRDSYMDVDGGEPINAIL
ncbi:MAG TPA: HD domain-containing phosphohydrolase [Clostridia bacterium]|nr:HD domain-containing phosphohydrolase [Clostridia bacterium]